MRADALVSAAALQHQLQRLADSNHLESDTTHALHAYHPPMRASHCLAASWPTGCR